MTKLQVLNTKFIISVPKKITKIIMRELIEREVFGKVIEHANPSTGEQELIVSAIGYDSNYPIHPNNNELYGKRYAYKKDNKGEWILYDRFSKADRISMPKGYYCTRPGHIVRGNIVKENGVQYFFIDEDVTAES